MFNDRFDAARQLADALAVYRGKNPLILAIPRGGVPIGAMVADALQGQLDVVLVHKLSSRRNPEYAIGAIDESGWACITDLSEADESWLQEEKARRLEGLYQRRALYSPAQAPINPHGRLVIVVDDGLATGATMLAALHAVRAAGPEKLICAVPVGAPDSLRKVKACADACICLHTPPDFQAVGQFYREFSQVSDDEVIACLARHRQPAPAENSSH